MSLPIITADQRLAERRGVKGVLVGKSGIGKTSQLWTLKPSATLFFDLEAGDLAVEGWAGDTVRPRTWQECRDFAVFIGGPNPALRDDQPYSQAHFDAVCQRFGQASAMDKYDTVFVDSITVAGRLCLQWCKGQPQAFSEKTGKPDTRGAYGLLGQELIRWLTHLQHARAGAFQQGIGGDGGPETDLVDAIPGLAQAGQQAVDGQAASVAGGRRPPQTPAARPSPAPRRCASGTAAADRRAGGR